MRQTGGLCDALSRNDEWTRRGLTGRQFFSTAHLKGIVMEFRKGDVVTIDKAAKNDRESIKALLGKTAIIVHTTTNFLIVHVSDTNQAAIIRKDQVSLVHQTHISPEALAAGNALYSCFIEWTGDGNYPLIVVDLK